MKISMEFERIVENLNVILLPTITISEERKLPKSIHMIKQHDLLVWVYTTIIIIIKKFFTSSTHSM